MKYYLVFALMIGTLVVNAQNKKLPWIIKFNATSLCDAFAFPAVQLSLEKRLTDHSSLSLEGGNQFYSFNHPDTVHLNPHGFKINIEYRYYLSKVFGWSLPPILTGSYIALQPFYRQNQYTTYVTYEGTATVRGQIDYLGVKKSIPGVNVIAGIQKPFRKMIVNLYAGIGVDNRTVRNTNREYDEKSMGGLAGTEESLFDGRNLKESSGISLNISAGLRIGFEFPTRVH